MSGIKNDLHFEFPDGDFGRTITFGGRNFGLLLSNDMTVMEDSTLQTALFLHLIDRCEKLEAQLDLVKDKVDLVDSESRDGREILFVDIKQLQNKVLGLD